MSNAARRDAPPGICQRISDTGHLELTFVCVMRESVTITFASNCLEASMHRLIAGIAVVVLSSSAMAQQPGARPPAPEKLFTSAADLSAMIAKAKSERKPDQP